MPRHALPALALCFAAAAGFWVLGGAAGDNAPVADERSVVRRPERADLELSDGPVLATNLQVLPGFEVTVYADDDLVHDAICLTTDRRGRPVVSGPGYIRVLIDHNTDGRADEAIPFANGPKTGAQGLHFDGPDLLAVGDAGLIRYRDGDGDLHADGPPTTLLKLKTGGEHHAHAIRPGPDGAWYLICGNDTGIAAADITDPISPVATPEAGVLLRFEIDRDADAVSSVSVVADGLRNAYDFDFTASGDPVTYDSDDEREVSLPWYRPTRVFRLLPGSHAGWLGKSWKRPDAFPEMPETLASLGRGSPTGVVVYRGDTFPAPFRRAIFVADWTFGRVVAIPFEDNGRAGEPIEFLTGTGADGFAPTDLTVAPDGSLLIAAGGRGTNGRLYRVRHAGPRQPSPARSPADAKEPFTLPAALADADPNVRKSAMHFVHRLSREEQEELRPRAEQLGPAALVRFHLGRLRRNREVDLAALEAAVSALVSPDLSSDVRFDAVRLAQLALGDMGPSSTTPETFSGYVARADFAEWQSRIDPIRSRLSDLFPTGDEAADHEFVRLLAMLRPEDPALLDRVLERITPDSHPTDDLHHLFAFARLPAARSERSTERTVAALLSLDAKLAHRRLNRDTNWDERLSDLFAALAEADADLAMSIVRHPEFGRPGHVAFLRKASWNLRSEAADAVIRAASADAEFHWSPETVSLLGTGDLSEARAWLRKLYDDPILRNAAVSALAEHPEESDREKFLAGLADPQIDVVERCLTALETLLPSGTVEEIASLVAALKRLDRDAREYAARHRVAKLLTRQVDGDLGFVFGPAGYRPQPEAVANWVAYARNLMPEAAVPSLSDEWHQVRSALTGQSTAGDPERGRAVYQAKSCNRCHDGGAVGPDLAGVADRFSRDDLFLAIADPDRDVSSRYRGTLIQTTDGAVVSGLVVYESADGVMLKDGERTWRIETDEIEVRRPLDTSLMPRGLLRGLRSQDLADLEAYLRTLGR